MGNEDEEMLSQKFLLQKNEFDQKLQIFEAKLEYQMNQKVLHAQDKFDEVRNELLSELKEHREYIQQLHSEIESFTSKQKKEKSDVLSLVKENDLLISEVSKVANA
mmetsp:Transcript_20456/g.19441  ORF Transcript_20456/g.19441 Transcript_20456/m.19441 type:complete len:106 (+) Transcript_20456:595-912(+)